MKVAIYPGSFNPWHDGHTDVLEKALLVFDKVIIAIGTNLDKGTLECSHRLKSVNQSVTKYADRVSVTFYDSLLVNFLEKLGEESIDNQSSAAIIKGLRNPQDFEYEKTQQYWNEDLGITIPTFYVISDRTLTHISSSAIKTVAKFRS